MNDFQKWFQQQSDEKKEEVRKKGIKHKVDVDEAMDIVQIATTYDDQYFEFLHIPLHEKEELMRDLSIGFSRLEKFNQILQQHDDDMKLREAQENEEKI